MSFAGEWYTDQRCHLCDAWCPQSFAASCNDPCVVSCEGSRVIIYPPPVIVTFPGPILSTCPQETVVGSSEVLEGCAPTPRTSLQAEVACSEPSAERVSPRYEPQCPPRSSYVYLSHWIHPCNRPGYRRYRSSGSQEEEHPPEKEKPDTENTDTENTDPEETETSEV